MAVCAEDYAQRLVADEERNQGWSWLDEPQEFWSFMKPMHYRVLEKYGFDRGLVQLPLVGTPNAHVPANVSIIGDTWRIIVRKYFHSNATRGPRGQWRRGSYGRLCDEASTSTSYDSSGLQHSDRGH